MRIAKVVGTVTLSRCHPSFNGARLRLVVPLSLAELSRCHPSFNGARLRLVVPLSLAELQGQAPEADEMVAWDDNGAGVGSLIAISEGAEASQPFRPELKPVDAYAAAILDEVNVQ